MVRKAKSRGAGSPIDAALPCGVAARLAVSRGDTVLAGETGRSFQLSP